MNLFRYTILFLIPTLLFTSCKEGDFNDESKRNENWAYWIDEDSGKASWIPITDETTVENGVYHLFYANGKIYEKGKLKNKINVDTVFRYSEMGNIIKYDIYQKDTVLYVYLKDGDYIEKYQNGKVYQKGKLSNGVFNDNLIIFYENGQPECIQEYVNGTGKATWYFESGKVSSIEYRVNRIAHGEVKHWYENGNLKDITNWNKGLKDGLHIFYYENGNKASLNFFKNDIVVGSLKNWNEKGQLIVEENYVNGNLNGKAIKYHDNGVVSISGYYKENELFGICEEYNENGKLIKKGYFENGNLIKEEEF